MNRWRILNYPHSRGFKDYYSGKYDESFVDYRRYIHKSDIAQSRNFKTHFMDDLYGCDGNKKTAGYEMHSLFVQVTLFIATSFQSRQIAWKNRDERLKNRLGGKTNMQVHRFGLIEPKRKLSTSLRLQPKFFFPLTTEDGKSIKNMFVVNFSPETHRVRIHL